MADFDINDLSKFGVIQDVPPYQLPPEAWNELNNVRFQDEALVRLAGRTQTMGTPGTPPQFVMPVINSAQAWWLYSGLTSMWVYDGTSHTDITRAAGATPYTASQGRDINGTILAGIPIINNGTDVPQYWPSYSSGVDMANLLNWNANWRAKVMRAFGSFLLALNVTKSGVNSPHMIKWSSRATVGTLPLWDETNPALDAGENELPDVMSGLILDGLPLKGAFYVYKESAVWRIRPISGRLIFAFDNFLETSGILATRCVAVTGDGGRHVALTNDDVVVHDGSAAKSILTKRMKRALFSQLSTTDYQNSFVFDNPLYNEMWICYPESGNTFPNKALIWNYVRGEGDGAFSRADIDFRGAAIGPIETATSGTWASASGTWDSFTIPWGQTSRRRVVAVKPQSTKLITLDVGLLNDGSPFTATAQRATLGLLGKKRSGEPIVDWKTRKFCGRVWIKATGGPVNVRMGWQETVEGDITWGSPVAFDPTATDYLDVDISGRALSVEFSTSASTHWELHGYKLEIVPAGLY